MRELRNFVERMLILYPGQNVNAQKLPTEYLHSSKQRAHAAASSQNDLDNEEQNRFLEYESDEALTGAENSDDFKAARNAFEARFLARKLKEYSGNVAKLAEAIGLERSYLYRKLRSYNIQAE